MAADSLQTEILCVLERKDELVILVVVSEEADSGGAVGQLFLVPSERSMRVGKPKQILSTNDTLRCLWISPSNAIWVGSADGNVGTTAKLNWPTPRRADLDYSDTGKFSKWQTTSLPVSKSKGLPPSITVLWGTSDSNVHAGTYGGHIYSWDGKAWTQTFEGPGKGQGTIRAFGGHSASNVFAVGANRTVLHFDGAGWRPVPTPGKPRENVGFTGVHNLPKGQTLISGSADQGILLHGDSTGLTEFGRYPIELIDMAAAAERVLFATGNGVAELIGRNVKMIRETFETATITAGKTRWFFTEPSPEVPGFIEFDPAYEDDPWVGFDY